MHFSSLTEQLIQIDNNISRCDIKDCINSFIKEKYVSEKIAGVSIKVV